MRQLSAVGLTAVLCVAAEADVPAQAPPEQNAARPGDPRWEVEIHGGLSASGTPQHGDTTIPATGALFDGKISVSTLYFGNATTLFNENLARLAGSPSAAGLTPLDSVLGGVAFEERAAAGGVGARLGRRLSRRLGFDITVDYDRTPLQFTSAARAAIEATRASFVPALQRVLSLSPIPSSVTSSVTALSDGRLSRAFLTAAMTANLRTSGKVVPYGTLGGGAVFNSGETPTATIAGAYQIGEPARLAARDTVILRYTIRGESWVGVGGGGIRYAVTPRWGIRADARVYLYPNPVVNLVNTTPSTALRSTGTAFPLINAGALQFSTTAPFGQPAVNALPAGTSVACCALPDGAKTFSGTGLESHVTTAFGIFWRF